MDDLTLTCIVDISKQAIDIAAFKKQLAKLPQVEAETAHLIHGDMYARTIFIPAGCALTGVTTKTDNICTVSGDISVTTDSGVVRLTGYHVIPANAGRSRAGFAHANTYWTTFFHTKLNDVEAIEDSVTDESELLQTRVISISNRPLKTIQG